MTPVDEVLAQTWRRMLPGDRRALALIGHCYGLERELAKADFVPWSQLETADRMALIRAMRVIGELAIVCADSLSVAAAELARAAPPSLRESLVNELAADVGLPAEQLERYWQKRADAHS